MTPKILNITFLDIIKMKFGAFAGKNIFHKSTKQQSQMNIFTYQNLKQINVKTWFDILEDGKYELMDKTYSDEKEYTTEQLEFCSVEFGKLYDLFFKKLNNQYSISTLEEKQERINLISKITILQECINSLLFIARNYIHIENPIELENKIYESVKQLSKYIKFPQFNTISENIEIINKLITSNEANYLRKYGKDTIEETTNNYTLEQQLIDIGEILSSGVPDAQKTSVEMFIAYINKANEISNLRKKKQDANKR